MSDLNKLKIKECLDSVILGNRRKAELCIPKSMAMDLGQSALQAMDSGFFINAEGRMVDWRDDVEKSCRETKSIKPDDPIGTSFECKFSETTVQIVNETTLQAAQKMVKFGTRPLALNFANGIEPGGGFLRGAMAQEETLCRSSALFKTLKDNPMYEFHKSKDLPESSDWVIYSKNVPVMRYDDGTAHDHHWHLSFLTCAAPYAPGVGSDIAAELLGKRILRVLAVSASLGYENLVLGAWGCGAFGNSPERTARDFRIALEKDFSGVFNQVVFAITDWSPERKFLGPFRDVFS